MAGTDILSQQVEVELFSGREGKNNESILALLIQEKLTAYQLSKRLGIAYATIFGRLRDLKDRKILEEQGKVRAARSHADIPLWGLAAYGFYFTATQEINLDIRRWALTECQRRFSSYWDIFWKLYEFDLSRHKTLTDRFLRHWIRSDEGIVEILRNFGSSPLEGESQALIVFRRMLDIGVILVQSEGDFVLNKLGTVLQSTNFTSALTYLGKLALNHPRLRTLHETVREIDGPLYSRIKSDAFTQTVVRLSKSSSEEVSRRLAVTPFFRDFPLSVMDMTDHLFVDDPLDEVVENAVEGVRRAVKIEKRDTRSLKKSAKRKPSIQVIHYPVVQKVVLEPAGYRIVTNDPAAISEEWLRNSHEVYVIDHKGEVKMRKGTELVRRT